jgi:hypothetical protein
MQEETMRKNDPVPYPPYREMLRGKNYMMKQELIDAAEASGLSESAIGYSFGDAVYHTVADFR